MAQAASGWVRPPGAAGPAAESRALSLLEGFLSERQRQDLREHDGFRYQDGSHLYWISVGKAPKCAFLERGEIQHYCVAPRGGHEMPAPDAALTLLLWIQADAPGFHREANIIRRQPFDPALHIEAVVKRLAPPGVTLPPHPGTPGRRGRSEALQDFTPLAPASPETRALALTRAREINQRLRMDDLRDLFARHGKKVPEETLRKLTGPTL